MSKSCCNHQHAAPIKAVSKAAPGQSEHHHDSHCCDNTTPVSCCSTPTPHEHASRDGNESPGDEEPPRGGCHDQACCSAPLSPAHGHEHDHEHDMPPADPLVAPAQGNSRHSWQVLGMDCPSCARKIETAVSRVSGVQQARVLFATEKLVVDLAPGLSPDPVTAAVLAAGFQLKGESADKQAAGRKQASQQPLLGNLFGNFLGKYWQPLSLAGLMLVAALLPKEFGQPLFTLATLWGLWPISRKAWALTKSGSPFAIETLMTVAAMGALFLGETAEAGMVLLLFMLGEHLEAYAAGRARAGVTALMALVPDKALRIRTTDEGEVREEVAADELRPGDIIEIAPGARLPADARLLDALGAFDESALTGESIPVERRQGDKVPAGSLAADRVLRLEVVSDPGNNAIDRILHLIEEAESQRAPIERFIDRFSRWYTPAMMLIALLVVLVPPLAFGQSWDEWIYRGLALLLIGCPCALVISTPAAVTSALAAATRQGALIKGGAALERLAHIDTVAFDKTGTLTLGKPQLTELVSLNGQPETELLALAAAIEQGSHHPLARAVVANATEQGLTLAETRDLRALPGMGVEGRINGELWQLLAPSRVAALNMEQQTRIASLERQGKTVVVLCQSSGDQALPVALLALRDQIRPEAAAALQELNRLGLNSIMLTGDNPRAAEAIATELGMGWRAGLLPEGKVDEIAKLASSQKVAMIGDGINDAPAMKRASIGIAMGGGTDVALETADAALTHNQLGGIAAMIRLSRAALANIHQNIALALGLKAIFLVTSLLGITGLWIAVLADTGATALVTANALRLLRKR
ncbi:zinc/cadmium/mercury/lead-transporting ATPase [Aeromonas veronii]|uniref:P-type Zn(2+) transporter n=1 Tax=Aeromonas veronii TaxID=654 RepID=A0ABY3MJ66_AERVE|nr:zinc/cadmium/mercury/lead-transporting ATPase [Aeromonas veronii]RDU83550.1 zinc/cadmium/mercury/lead-transporting ATPase [Aeromonas veronii]RDU86734.1 zinc/cadmium/mercury/lead-transporting ATPase [Aeromonas veronii]RDU89459.1 zinc/cadmium/mercury/lead-transporting ATPase [Aeromonas veronii]RDU92582.1 zinc/cadmium/mercury/lead-transporting ATPase [Aeromonas veronii]TEY49918.1 zinc/cadmium/mercury/lead-transporting ATPase [Aeromonas veronii]